MNTPLCITLLTAAGAAAAAAAHTAMHTAMHTPPPRPAAEPIGYPQIDSPDDVDPVSRDSLDGEPIVENARRARGPPAA